MGHEHDAFSEEDDTEEEIVLNNRPAKLTISATKAPNLYADSPRVSRRQSLSVNKDELRQRKLIGCSSLIVLFLSVILCIVTIKFLSTNENLSAITPNQRNFMLSTKAAGAKETLSLYTSESRFAGSNGDYIMADYIRNMALEFGIPSENVKLSEYEILLNDPQSIRVGYVGGNKNLYDLTATYLKSNKTNNRFEPPPFHLYSKNGTAKGKLIFANYGSSEDYRSLRNNGISVQNAILIIRMGRLSLPAKILLAQNNGAIGVLTYTDPNDNTFSGNQHPTNKHDRASFGTVYLGNGDPSTPDDVATAQVERLPIDMVFSSNNTRNLVPLIVSVPISAKLAQAFINSISVGSNASSVFPAFVNTAVTDISYVVGPSNDDFYIENLMKYSVKKTWNVIISIDGTRESDRVVLVGSGRDSAVSGAVNPGSGNAVFIEVLRGIGGLIGSGWAPHRSILLTSFDAEQYGSVGTAEWIDKHASHFASRAVVYIDINDPVHGAGILNCEATSSIKSDIYYMAHGIAQPENSVSSTTGMGFNNYNLGNHTTGEALTDDSDNGNEGIVHKLHATSDEISSNMMFLHNTSIYGLEDLTNEVADSLFVHWFKDTKLKNKNAKAPEIKPPGYRRTISPFVSRLAVPYVDMFFYAGYYDVEYTSYDTLDWMKTYGDPSFTFHRAAAQMYGSVMLSFSDSIFLQYDFMEYGDDIRLAFDNLKKTMQTYTAFTLNLDRLEKAIAQFQIGAIQVNKEIQSMTEEMLDVLSGKMVVDIKRTRDINNRLIMTERAFLFPEGLPTMPWMKHSIYGHSIWNDYNATYFPGIYTALYSSSQIDAKHQLHRLCRVIEDATDTLTSAVLA